MKEVQDLSLVLALAEMRLSFEAKEGVSVEDFIRGVLDNCPEGVSLFGGNSMPDDMAAKDLAGAQFFAGQALKGYIVALGIGGPVKAFGNHANEFRPCGDIVTVTETKDKWIVTLDDQPAMEVYRKLRGMDAEDELKLDGPLITCGKKDGKDVLTIMDANGGNVQNITKDELNNKPNIVLDALMKVEELYELIRSLQPHTLISYKKGFLGTEDFKAPERKFNRAPGDTTMLEIWNSMHGHSWGYDKQAEDMHRTVDGVMGMLKQAAGKKANLLLNTGPLPDGSIHPADVKTLKAVGERLRKK